ncbi:MAG TPA: efflux RND transporter periplasmic adaptor subunit [Vicinamibacterales bacterium]|nr:efflux RND transporter periplasmic adaptor subunit [Vicinamibacterales bacterium]
MPETKVLRWPLVVSICLAIGCGSKPGTEAARPVKTLVVGAGNKPQVRSFPGKVEAAKSVELAFQVPGLLIKEPGKEGQKVARDQIIAQLRQEEFQARLTAAESQLEQAQATLSALKAGERSEEQMRRESQLRAAQAKVANAKTEYERYSRLLQSSAVSRSDYELAQTTYRIAQEEEQAARQVVEKGAAARSEDVEAQEAVVRGLESRADEARLQLKDSTLRAPYDGVIAQRLVNQGQPVGASTPVVKFQDDEIDIVMDVPESFMANEMRNTANLGMVAQLSGASGQTLPVAIKEAAQVADPKTQTFQVRVATKRPAGFTVLPGMTAIVTVTYWPAGGPTNRMLVPISAVTRLDTGRQVVWILAPNLTVSPRPVTMGAATGGTVEILSGVRPGERVVVAGGWSLHDGMKVTDLGNALGESPV